MGGRGIICKEYVDVFNDHGCGHLMAFLGCGKRKINSMDQPSIAQIASSIRLQWISERYFRMGRKASTQQGRSSWMPTYYSLDIRSLFFYWTWLRISPVDKALLVLKMRISVIKGVTFFIMDYGGGAVVRGRVSITFKTTWTVLQSSQFLIPRTSSLSPTLSCLL